MKAEQLQESYRKSNESWLDRLTAACGDLTSEQKEAIIRYSKHVVWSKVDDDFSNTRVSQLLEQNADLLAKVSEQEKEIAALTKENERLRNEVIDEALLKLWGIIPEFWNPVHWNKIKEALNSLKK